MQCRVCASTKIQDKCTVNNYQLVRCGSCSHVFVSNFISQKDSVTVYSEDYYLDYTKAGYKNYLQNASARISGFQSKLAHIEKKYRQQKGYVLDYGCAIGLFVKVAQDSGWNAKGIDVSKWAIAFGRKNYDIDIYFIEDFLRIGKAEMFDVITLWDTIEHVNDPNEIFRSIRGWLKPNGLIVFNTINISSLGAFLAGESWRHIAPPHHLQYYTRKSLNYLLKSHGFEVDSTHGDGVVFAKVGRNPWLARQLNLMVRYWRIRPIVTKLNMLDEVTIYAVKK